LAIAWPAIAVAGPAGVTVGGADAKDVQPPAESKLETKVVGPDAERSGAPGLARRADAPDDISFLDVVAVGTLRGYTCSGVVISPRLVLTARHCGKVDRIAFGSQIASALATHTVERIVVHPDPAVDAVLLRTRGSIPAAPRPRRSARDAAPPSGIVRLIGFGISDFRTRTGFGTKRRVDVPVHGWGCDGRRPARTGCRPDAEMLVISDRGNDTCGGDSGGAVLERTGGSWRLIAITSRAVAQSSHACGAGGVYVRADYLDPWIAQTMKELP
jgi:hypothetical protein